MRSLVLGLVLMAGACKGDDTDTDPDTDTSTNEDLPPTFIGFIEKPNDVERKGTQILVGAVHVEVQQDGSWTVLETLASGKLSGTGNFGMELPPTVAAEHHVDLGGGLRGALYVPVVFDDANRDDVYQDGETDLVLGINHDRWLAWLQEGGSEPGWVVVDPTQEPWTRYKLTEQAVVNLRGLGAEGKVSGIYEGADKGLGVRAVDGHILDGDYNDYVIWQSTINPENGQFTAKINLRPPADLFYFPEDSIRYIRALNLIYKDNDASGTWTEGDALTNRSLCYEGKPLYLRYSDTPRKLEIARTIDELGWISGWRFYVLDGEQQVEVGRDKLTWIPVDDSCTVSLPTR